MGLKFGDTKSDVWEGNTVLVTHIWSALNRNLHASTQKHEVTATVMIFTYSSMMKRCRRAKVPTLTSA